MVVFDESPQKVYIFLHGVLDDHSYKAACTQLPTVVTCIYTFDFLTYFFNEYTLFKLLYMSLAQLTVYAWKNMCVIITHFMV
jgi:hypothetical protein